MSTKTSGTWHPGRPRRKSRPPRPSLHFRESMMSTMSVQDQDALRASIDGSQRWDFLGEAHWLTVAVAGAVIDALLAGELLLKMGGFGWRHALRTNKLNSALLVVSITTRALVAANVTVPALVRAADGVQTDTPTVSGAEDFIVFGSVDGRVHAVKAGDGTAQWTTSASRVPTALLMLLLLLPLLLPLQCHGVSARFRVGARCRQCHCTRLVGRGSASTTRKR